MEKYLGLPFDASAQGPQIDSLIGIVHWLMLALFVGWGAFFVYTLIRFRRKAHPKADYHGVKTHTSSYLEVGIALIEAVLLIGFSIPFWARKVSAFPAEKDAVVVHVVAEQFSWNIHYPGPDGVFGRTSPDLIAPDNPLGLDRTDPYAKDDITTVNQLNLPVDKPVIVHLSSKDVIHSFNLPVMRVKQDAVPGLNIPVWFTPVDTGHFEIACAQLCGLGHYRMRGYLTIQTPEDYKAWVDDQEKQLAPPPADTTKAVAAVADSTAKSAN